MSDEPTLCLCGYRLDPVTCVTEAGLRPRPGSIVVCPRCVRPLIFDEELSAVPITPHELVNLPYETRFQLEIVQLAFRRLHKTLPASHWRCN